MKVLLINNCFYRRGGSEAVFFGSADLLKEKGHEVVYFSMEDDQNIHTDNHEYFVGRGGKLSQMKDYFCNVQAAKKIEEIIKKEKPDIAHAHLLWGGIGPSIFGVLHKYGIPIVHTAHDYRMVCPAYTFRNGRGEVCEKCKGGHFVECVKNRCGKGGLVQSLLMAAEMRYRDCRWHPAKELDGIVYVSQFAKDKHIEIDPLFAKTKSIVLYNCSHKGPKIEKGRGSYFLYFGRLSHEKGVEMLIEAFKQLPGQKLKIVGTGPLEQSLKAIAAGSPQVEFLGFKQGKELQDLVRNAHFVIVPSQWYENNPMTIVESYSLGTPVIGSDLGGIPEIIKEGATGFVFKHDSIESLLYKINIANEISNQAYFSMTESARRFYDNNFSEDTYADKLVGFYEDVIAHWKDVRR